MRILDSRSVVATDEEAAIALREFFTEVAAKDGEAEVRRLYLCFYQQCHGEAPLLPKDWSDKTRSGTLDGGKRLAATNGK